LRLLREKVGDKIIALSVGKIPFQFRDRIIKRKNLKEFANVIDFVNVMNFDYVGAWSEEIGHSASCER